MTAHYARVGTAVHRGHDVFHLGRCGRPFELALLTVADRSSSVLLYPCSVVTSSR